MERLLPLNGHLKLLDTCKHFQCTFYECSASFDRQWKLNQHICRHTNQRPFQCTFTGCSKRYKSNSHLQRHVTTSHNTRPPVFLQCPYADCKTMLSNQYSLKKHCKNHLEKSQSLKCPTCKQTFKQQDHYDIHVALLEGCSPFSCTQCDIKFKNKTDLNRHARKHKSYACEYVECQIVSETYTDHLKHTKLHLSLYSCDICKKEFKNKSFLKEHVLSHVNQADRDVFQCPYEGCTRTYFQKRNLTQHITSYHKKQRFACNYTNCSKTFAFKTTLLHHQVKHNKTDPLNTKTRKDKELTRAADRFNLTIDVENIHIVRTYRFT